MNQQIEEVTDRRVPSSSISMAPALLVAEEYVVGSSRTILVALLLASRIAERAHVPNQMSTTNTAADGRESSFSM